ncbi:MAG: DUF1156 domain-containing protein [Gammaproteobacteria bacterium]|nr:DUF1156 domain-containing protein [Gammaproteobacteria bacterium]
MRLRKKLIEVAIPLKEINEASAKEKSIRHGHPSTLHLWWARRPLAACRAVLFAQFVDDPSSVPEEFPDEAAQEAERQRLFAIIKRLVPWRNSNDETVLRDARREIARSVARARGEAPPRRDGEIDAYLAEKAPPVVDPFCGGGSIPLEAQRLGLRAHGSDLNPVAVLITKALVEIPPRFAGRPPVNPDARESLGVGAWEGRGASGLAEDVRYYGRWMRDEAEKRIGHLYPKVEVTTEDGPARPDLKPYAGRRLTVIAWLWARTVASPNPAVNGVHVPLVSSFVLSSRKGSESIVVPVVEQGGYRFTVKSVGITAAELESAKSGTKNGRANFTCLMSRAPVSAGYVKSEGTAGRMRAKLMAVVAEGKRSRVYLQPPEEMERAARVARPAWEPAGSVPKKLTGGTCYGYGLTEWADLFTNRQLVALTTFSDLVGEARDRVKRDCRAAAGAHPGDDAPLVEGGDGEQAYADAVATYLGLSVSRQANRCSNLSFWHSGRGTVEQVFARQALPMVWDFCEGNPFSNATGNFLGQLSYLANVLAASPPDVAAGEVRQRDATSDGRTDSPPPCIVATDPPYYDNIGYADLSDFFYVWLRASLKSFHPTLFQTRLTPKTAELVATPHRFAGVREDARRFFEAGFGQATSLMRDQQAVEFPMTLFYAYKQSESVDSEGENGATASTGWATMLAGVIGSGFTVESTWPVRTELPGNLKKRVAALASSIVLVCRPRPPDAGVVSRLEFVSALKRELPIAIGRLQGENIAPVDLAQAAIGPGMAVFSRYAQVLEANGEPMVVRQALIEINRALDGALTEADFDMDDDSRFCVAWFEQYGMDERPYGEAEVLFTAKNTSSEGLERAGVLVVDGGSVRLKRRDELEPDWDPATDTRIADWECVQHLVRAMTDESADGVTEAARLAAAMGPRRAETARALAYRLHAVSGRRGWSAEALAYNILASSWPQIQEAVARLGEEEQPQLRV